MDPKNQYLINDQNSCQINHAQVNYQQQGVMYPPQQPQMPQQGIPINPQQGGMYNPPQMGQPQNYQCGKQDIPNNSHSSQYPVIVKCPQCNEVSTTTITTQAGSGTYTMAAILCLFTGCCCIPFFVDSCQDKVHQCPRCQFVVGINEYKIC